MTSQDAYDPSQEMSQLPELLDRSDLDREGRDIGRSTFLVGSGGYFDSQTTDDEYFGNQLQSNSEAQDLPTCADCSEKDATITSLENERGVHLAHIQSLEAQIVNMHQAGIEKDVEIARLGNEVEELQMYNASLQNQLSNQQIAALQREEAVREEFRGRLRQIQGLDVREYGQLRVPKAGTNAGNGRRAIREGMGGSLTTDLSSAQRTVFSPHSSPSHEDNTAYRTKRYAADQQSVKLEMNEKAGRGGGRGRKSVDGECHDAAPSHTSQPSVRIKNEKNVEYVEVSGRDPRTIHADDPHSRADGTKRIVHMLHGSVIPSRTNFIGGSLQRSSLG